MFLKGYGRGTLRVPIIGREDFGESFDPEALRP
jgi:hypothetical protein